VPHASLLMVSSRRRLMEHFERSDDGSWVLREYGPGATVPLRSPDASREVDALDRLAIDDAPA